MKVFSSLGMFLARLLLAIPFVFSGVGKLFNYDGTIQYMASKGMTMLPVMYTGAVIVEVLVGLCLIIGYFTRLSALILLAFLISVTYIFHDFWNVPPEQYLIMQIMFFKNLAIMGGLLAILSCGPGGCSVDACTCRPKEKQPEEKVAK